MSFPVAVAGDLNDPVGITGRLVPPMAPIYAKSSTVLAEGKPVLTVGATAMRHGNPTNPKAPGFNPPCAHATVVGNTISNILVEGKPLAIAGPPGTGSVLSCSHVIQGPGAQTIRVGLA
jgi:uncharacterized Zn-binding protein involved in type VI secretion